MSNEFISKEVAKILKDEKSSKNYALASAWIIAHFKGINIKIFDTKETSSLCDYNIIASAENIIQSKSMAQVIVKTLKEHGAEVLSLEGLSAGEWILLDIGDVIIHIFQEISRDVFDLDDIWRSSEQVEIPNEYYFGEANQEIKPKVNSENYF